MKNHTWTYDIPTEEGTYLFKCDETDFDNEIIPLVLKEGELWAIAPIGWFPIRNYHEALTDTMWYRLGGLSIINNMKKELDRFSEK